MYEIWDLEEEAPSFDAPVEVGEKQFLN